MADLSGFIFWRPPFPIPWLPLCQRLAILRALQNHTPFKLRKGKKYRQDQVPGQGVFNQTDIQNVYLYAPGE